MTAFGDKDKGNDNLLRNCTLCPRRCGNDRTAGEPGYCGAGARPKLARASLHFGEEPCLSGTRGSGTVFFSHCNLRCVFCQNHPISQGGAGREVTGREVTVDELAETFLGLQRDGAHNINLVSPTPYLPMIAEAVAAARRQGLRLPIVHNSNGYETVEAIGLLRGTVDVYLPDFKYGPEATPPEATAKIPSTPATAAGESAAAAAHPLVVAANPPTLRRSPASLRYSAAPHYFEIASQAIAAMAAQVGPAEFDDNGLIRRGVIVRHLVLPGMIEDSKRILRWIKENLPEGVLLSLMSQYTPLYRAARYPEINRRLSLVEYSEVLDFCVNTGLTDGFAQDLSSAGKAMIPAFDLSGVLDEP